MDDYSIGTGPEKLPLDEGAGARRRESMDDWTMSEQEVSEFADMLKTPTEREVKNVSLQFTLQQWQVLSRIAGPGITVRKWIMALVGAEVKQVARMMAAQSQPSPPDEQEISKAP